MEYLALVDQLLIKQQVEMLEAITGWEDCNKYRVMNSMGQDVFFAKEDNDCCNRMCCGSGRSFEMEIVDNMGREIIHLVRPMNCQECCFPCCLQYLEVQSPRGQVIGTVEQLWNICSHPMFSIKNANGDEILKIEEDDSELNCHLLCGCECCSDIHFLVKSKDGSEVKFKIILYLCYYSCVTLDWKDYQAMVWRDE